MTTKIEQIIAFALIERIGSPWPWEEMEPQIKELWLGHARSALAALDAAGLAVLPKEATKAMCSATLGMDEDWRAMVARFDPTTYEPEPTE